MRDRVRSLVLALADPETLLPLSGLAEHDFGPGVPRSLELEYAGGDYAAKHDLARRSNPTGSLSAETGGDLARSSRWDQVMRPAGIGDVAAAACRDALGCWGWIEAYRDVADRSFEAEDLELLANVGPSLGSALRRGVMAAERRRRRRAEPSGVIVLDPDLKLVSWTAGAREWIDALPSTALRCVRNAPLRRLSSGDAGAIGPRRSSARAVAQPSTAGG